MPESNPPEPVSNANDPAAEGIETPAKQPETPRTEPAPPAKPRKRRRWRWVVAAFGVLLLLGELLIALAPTLASMGWARAIVVEQINKNLNGRVEITDYSVSWTGGQKASGVRVYDADSALIAEVASASTQLSLLDAVRGRFNCGETTIAGVGFTLKQYADGSTNFERLLKRPSRESPERSNTPTEKTTEPLKLPAVRMHLQLTGWHGVVERESPIAGKAQVIDFDGIDADVNITDINSPIDHSLKIVARVDNGPSQGTFTEKGTLAVIQNNQLDPSIGSIKESVVLGNFDLAGTAPFLPPSVRQLAGVANGNIDIDVSNGKSGTIGAALDVRKATIALASFEPGESLPLDQISLSMPQPITIDLSAGPEHWADWVFKVGDGSTQQIALVAQKDGTNLFDLTLKADVTPGQIIDLAYNRTPAGPKGTGAAGRVEVVANADPGKLFQLLPKRLALRNGVELTSARVGSTVSANFSPLSVALSASLELRDGKGRNTIEKRDLAIEPFHLSFTGKTFGGDGWKMPDLRGLALSIQHGQGVNADFKGEDLTSVNGELHLKPREILAEVGQFIDLGDRQADGDITLTAQTEGEPSTRPTTTDNSKSAVNRFKLQLVTRDLKLRGIAGPAGATLAQRFIGAEISGEVDRDRASGQVETLKGLKLVASAGDEAKPNVVADLDCNLVTFQNSVVTDPVTGTSSTVRTASIPEFKANKLGIVDLKLAQADFGDFLPGLKDIRIDHGSMSLAGTSGSYDGPRTVLGFQVFPRIDELTASKMPPAPTTAPTPGTAPPAAPVQVVSGYSLLSAADAKVSSENGTTRFTLLNLSITDSPRWLSITKAGDAPLEIASRLDGTLSAQGSVKVAMELAPFCDIASKIAATPVALGQTPHPMKLTSGRLEGTLALASAQADAIGLSADLDASSLTVSGDGAGVNNESLRIVLRASMAGDLSQLAVSQFDATGSVVTAHVPKAVIWLKTGTGKDARTVSVLQMPRELSASADIPDAGKLQAMVDALLPAEPVALATELPSGAPATLPVHAKLTAGSLALKLDVTNKDNQLTFIPDLQGKGLAFAAGPVKYKVGDVGVKAKAIVVTDPAAAALGPDGQPLPVLQQIRQLLVPELLATGAGTTIALVRPIVIQDPAYLSDAFASAPTRSTASGQATKPAALPPGKAPSIDAAISLAGDLRALSNLLDALAGRQPAPSYLATYSFQQTLTTQNRVIKFVGKGSLQDFTVLDTDHKTPSFSEKNVAVENDVSLDGTNGPAVLSIGKVRLAMESSKALDLNLSGTIHDLFGQRDMDHVIADVSYDGEQLTPILRSMLAPKPTPADPHPVDRFKDLRLAGRKTERFAVWGSYPANQPFEQSVASLSASGALAVDFLDTVGLNIQKLQVPVYMDHGVIKLAFAPGSAPGPAPATLPTTGPADVLTTTAVCNGGAINLSGITVDLTAPSPLLSIPPETKVLDNVALNKVLAATANTYLPIIDATDATGGTLTFIVHRCDRVPIEQLTTEASTQTAGMDFSISFTNIQLGGPIVDAIEVGVKDFRANLRGDVPDARFQLGSGRLNIQNFNLLGGKNKLPVFKLAGKVGLPSDGVMNLTASVPPELLAKIIPDKKLLQYMPDKLDFTITGTKSAPRPSLDKALQKALEQAGKKALLKGLGGNLFPGGGHKGDPSPTTGPSGQ